MNTTDELHERICAPYAWLRPMRGLKKDRSARVVLVGHAFVQNLRRGDYELAAEEPIPRRLPMAFDELALAI
jgi:IS6 family transposase